MSNDNVISIRIEGESSLDLDVISKVLASLQKTIYRISQTDNPNIPKKGGRLAIQTKKEYTLQVKNLSTGSLHAKMEMISEEADKILEKTSALVNGVQKESEDTINGLFTNPHLRNQTLNTLIGMWSSFDAIVTLDTPELSVVLSPDKRKFITNYIKKHPIRSIVQRTFTGRLIGAELGGDRKFKIDSTEGVYFIEVPESKEVELHNLIKYQMLKIVRVSGRFEIGITKLKVDKIDEIEITEEKHTEILYGKRGNEFLKLKNPLSVIIVYDTQKEVVSMENDEFDIFALEKTVYGAYISIKEQFDVLLEKFLFSPEKGLSKDALELKQKLHEVVYGG